MIEYVYSIRNRKSSWRVNIKIIAEIKNCPNAQFKDGSIKVAERIWLKYADEPLIKNEIFCADYLPYFAEGLKLVQAEIQRNSSYDETLIIINSVQFNPSDFQEEGLTAAIIEWASKAFNFQTPTINVDFDKKKNRYIFSENPNFIK